MENKIIIIYQSNKGHTKTLATKIAEELKCDIVDVATNPKVNLEQYNLIGFGSGVYYFNFGKQLKKWIKAIKWSSGEALKPDVFIFSTQGAPSARGAHIRFTNFLSKKQGLIVTSAWACQSNAITTTDAMNNLRTWLQTKISIKKES